MMEQRGVDQALASLGALLQERGQAIGVLVIGGGGLLLLGFIQRPTADVDIVGFASPSGYVKVEGLPPFLAQAVREVGEAHGLGETWFNSGPAGLIDFGLPAGLQDRVEVRVYGGLEVHIPARDDLICFKLFATVDQGERSKHFTDLQRLAPTTAQLVTGARWARSQDPSPGFLGELRRILTLLDRAAADADF